MDGPHPWDSEQILQPLLAELHSLKLECHRISPRKLFTQNDKPLRFSGLLSYGLIFCII